MEKDKTEIPLPDNFYLLQEPGFSDPDDTNRPNRLCICISDLHFTDGTVGNQSADEVVWEEVFNYIMDLCINHDIKELTLVLAGDVVDVIRSAQWTASGVYPWERKDHRFKTTLRKIMEKIIQIHANKPDGFFYLLKQLRSNLDTYEYNKKKIKIGPIRILSLLGNHDKEILADDETLKMFYEECLGQPVGKLSDGYRRWIGKMYFNNENKYLDGQGVKGSHRGVPWLPFYFGDRGFRLFVTHGHWRDIDNCRKINAKENRPGWKVKDGWRPDVWRNLNFEPFTEPCFGDTVAAGVLSGFIYRAKNSIEGIETSFRSNLSAVQINTIKRLKRVLDELDLYRPTSSAVKRIIEESRLLSRTDSCLSLIRSNIEEELVKSISNWLSWGFTFKSASFFRRWLLRVSKVILFILKITNTRIQLAFLNRVMSLLAKLQRFQRDDPKYHEMLTFPAFLEKYREYGFRIHGEGHTHIPLEEELYFKSPNKRQNYTYINFGAWRDQLVSKSKKGYRRRGVGRALIILDLAKLPHEPSGERRFTNWVEDIHAWADHLDLL